MSNTSGKWSLADFNDITVKGPTWDYILQAEDLYRNQYRANPPWTGGYDENITPFRSGSGRQTGRTSEMLWQAACAKDEGHRVMVVVHEERMIEYCLHKLLGGWWGLERRDFVTIKNAWQLLRGATGVTVLLDHFVAELAHESRLIAKCLHELEYEMKYHNMKFSAIPQPRLNQVIV